MLLISGNAGNFSYGAPPPPVTYTSYSGLTDLTPVAGWATVRRNPVYSGPAIEITDFTNAANITDVYFDANGALSGAVPYGADARVTTIYDQFGSEDLTISLATAPEVSGDDVLFTSWRVVFKRLGGFVAPSATDVNPAWKLGNTVWSLGIIRRDNSGLDLIWGVDSPSAYMEIGVWQEGPDLHCRINGGGPLDWSNTDWSIHSADVQNVLSRVVHDCFTTPAKGYMNGVDSLTYNFSSPITYSTGRHLYLGGSSVMLGTPMLMDFTELVIFDATAALSTTNKDSLDAALDELNA